MEVLSLAEGQVNVTLVGQRGARRSPLLRGGVGCRFSYLLISLKGYRALTLVSPSALHRTTTTLGIFKQMV